MSETDKLAHEQRETPEPIMLCADALSVVVRLNRRLPRLRFEEVDDAERAVVQLRDCLIDHLRSGGPPDRVAQLKAMLARVNAALSLIAGVEYPAAGIQQNPLDDAQALLQGILDERGPSGSVSQGEGFIDT